MNLGTTTGIGAILTPGQVLRHARRSAMTLREFSRTTGVSPAYISMIEHDKRTCPRTLLQKYEGLVNLNLSQYQESKSRQLALNRERRAVVQAIKQQMKSMSLDELKALREATA